MTESQLPETPAASVTAGVERTSTDGDTKERRPVRQSVSAAEKQHEDVQLTTDAAAQREDDLIDPTAS